MMANTDQPHDEPAQQLNDIHRHDADAPALDVLLATLMRVRCLGAEPEVIAYWERAVREAEA